MSYVKTDRELNEELIRIRREFHKHPEPGWLEYRTSAKIAEILENLGYSVHVGKEVCKTDSRMGVPKNETLIKHENKLLAEGIENKWIELMKGGQTGVVGVFKSDKPGPIIALRFDIDSLELTESADEQHEPMKDGYRSVYKGSMHACGHDGHAAIGIGVAKLLIRNKDQIKGEIRLLFQPAEEGCRGAKSMVDKGWLDDVDYFYCGHIGFQSFQLGEIVASVEGFMATTKIDVSYSGKETHAGNTPEIGRSALLAAAATSLHLQGIARHSGGKTRVNVGLLQAGSGRNIVPGTANLSLETRGETTELNDYMTAEAIRIIENTAKVYGVECHWKIVGKATGAQTDETFTNFIEEIVKSVNGVESVIPLRQLNASEDAVYMLNKVQEQGGQASYMLFGSNLAAGHHEPSFNFNEGVLLLGAEVLSTLVFASIKKYKE